MTETTTGCRAICSVYGFHAFDCESPEAAMERDRPECVACGHTDGPYPRGDRPVSSFGLVSGCPRCGWCF